MDGAVLGVDACKAGWVGVVLGAGEPAAVFGVTIGEVVERAATDLAVVAIDMPIGLADHGFRQADVLAKKEAGPFWASVFMTPVREAVMAADYETAQRHNRTCTGQGISKQAYGLAVKIREVDAWVRGHSQDGPVRNGQPRRVVEVHPELSFARMNGAPLLDRKTRWAGVECRRALLAHEGISLTGDLGEAGRHAQVDDVLDAAAAAWSARRVASGRATSLPDPPQKHSDGWPCAIWT